MCALSARRMVAAVPSRELGALAQPLARARQRGALARAAPRAGSVLERLDQRVLLERRRRGRGSTSAAASMSAPACISAGSAVKMARLARVEISRPRETRVERRPRPRRRAGSWPAARPRPPAPPRRPRPAGRTCGGPGGVSAEAWASTLAREEKPPRRPARSATRSSRSATSASVPRVALAACQASSSTQAELGGRRRQRRVHPAALAPWRGVVRRRPHQRVPEPHGRGRARPGRPPRPRRRPRRGRPSSLGRRADQVEVAGGVGGRDQQPQLERRA